MFSGLRESFILSFARHTPTSFQFTSSRTIGMASRGSIPSEPGTSHSRRREKRRSRGWPDKVTYLLWPPQLSSSQLLSSFSLWLALHNTPASSLYPDPTVKVLGVAIWFADSLEKDKQSVRAYRLLEEAIDLIQTRFKEPSVQKGDFNLYARRSSSLISGFGSFSLILDRNNKQKCMVLRILQRRDI